MNYHRGLQRLYAMLTVVWFAIVLLTTPADRFDFWKNRSVGTATPVVTSVTWSGEQNQEIDFIVHGKNFQQGCFALIAIYSPESGWRYLDSLQPRETHPNLLRLHYRSVPVAEDLVLVENPGGLMSQPTPFVVAAEQPEQDNLFQNLTRAVDDDVPGQGFLWFVLCLLLPPALGYAALFVLIPWIFRGFKSPKQRSVRVT